MPLALSDRVEQLVSERGALPRLVGIRHVFAEVVDADGHAEAVDGRRGGEGVVDAQAGDEAARQTPSHPRPLGERAKTLALRERDEDRAKHYALATTTAQTRAAPAATS